MQALRQAVRAVATSAESAALQSRSFKGMPAKKNPHVENWYNAREDLEMHNQITSGMIASGLFWGAFIPYLTYEAIVAELRHSEQTRGRPFILVPDEVGYGKPGVASQKFFPKTEERLVAWVSRDGDSLVQTRVQ
eukprot:TRINITY_DN4599_c0_g1_i1.p3 TRINITY_DN4599_c0_g1~~TRINITY_DN4599_c0_g1_i1.p3  ORF type:complete len:135 (-),score=14.42 TRINITY_DN4599_c0_g1_i1:436-840(-)